jgi:2-dehydro-3-deoxyglucarate aldolase
MSKLEQIIAIRDKIAGGKPSVGTWMQLPNGSVAEILGAAGYDWVCVDLEHGSISAVDLPDLFRAIELGGAVPMARMIRMDEAHCKQALDAGALGLIAPKIETRDQILDFVRFSKWPPAGERGVAFSRANLFGKNFQSYREISQQPFLAAMIETYAGVQEIQGILDGGLLDAIFIGPYDLSASLGITAEFEHPLFLEALEHVRQASLTYNVPLGIHVVEPELEALENRIREGYTFIARSIDAVFLQQAAIYENPDL